MSEANSLYGYIMIIAVAVTTAGLTETTEIAEAHFDFPFIMRYICMASGICVSVPLLIWKVLHPRIRILRRDRKAPFYGWSFIGSMALTGGGMIYFLSFDGISVPSATALGGTRAMMVLFLSVLILKETLTLWKIAAVLVSVLGILCFVYESGEDTGSGHSNGVKDTLTGCILCLFANFLFAACDVVAGKVSQSYAHKVAGSMYYQIVIGLYQIPVFVWVWWWPSTPRQNEMDEIWWCLLPALALSANNVSVFIGVTIKSPFYVNIGTLLGIPMAFIVDIFVHQYHLQIVPILGACLLMISFLMLEVISPPKRMQFLRVALINGKAMDEVSEIEEEEYLVKPRVPSYGGHKAEHHDNNANSINGVAAQHIDQCLDRMNMNSKS